MGCSLIGRFEEKGKERKGRKGVWCAMLESIDG